MLKIASLFLQLRSARKRGSFKTDPGLYLSRMALLYLVQIGKVTSSHFGHWEASL